jgi:hypothetical protein
MSCYAERLPKGLNPETTGWDEHSSPPEPPPPVLERTREKYLEALLLLTGESL